MTLRTPITLAVFAAMGVLLSGCLAYDAASAVVSVGSTAVGAAGTVVGTAADVVTSPFDKPDPKTARDR